MKAFAGAYRLKRGFRIDVMLRKLTRFTFAGVLIGGLVAQEPDWIAAENDAQDLVHLRVSLTTAYLEAGDYRAAQDVLLKAQKSATQKDDLSRAELLNAWSALHLKLGQLPTAEAELLEARRLVMKIQDAGELLPTIGHNLAAIEMRIGRYSEALEDEREAIRVFEKILAPDHPTLIRSWASLASLQYMMGEPQEARISMEKALASAEKTLGSMHPLVADLLESYAIVLDKLKLKTDARHARDRARGIPHETATSTVEHPQVWSILEPSKADGRVHLRAK